MHNSFPNDMRDTRYGELKGATAIGAFDFAYKSDHLIVRGNADYGYVGDAATISTVKRNLTSNSAPYKKTPVGQNAMAVGLEAGYDIFRLFNAGAVRPLFGAGDSLGPTPGLRTGSTTAGRGMSSRPSCGTATARRATPMSPRRSSTICQRKTVRR